MHLSRRLEVVVVVADTKHYLHHIPCFPFVEVLEVHSIPYDGHDPGLACRQPFASSIRAFDMLGRSILVLRVEEGRL